MVENHVINLLKYKCESFQASTTLNITKKHYDSLPFQKCMVLEDIEIPGLHHQYSRKGVIHDILFLVFLGEKSKYEFVIKYSINMDSKRITCRETNENINDFISNIFDLSKVNIFDFIGNFKYSKQEYIVEVIESNINSKSVGSKKAHLPPLLLSGLHYKGSGPVRSIIIDTYSDDYSNFTISGANEFKYSADNIIKRFMFFSRIANGFVSKK